MKVLAAMSGGVDSSVAASRLMDMGHDVVGVHLALSSNPATLRTSARGCCSLEDSADARRVCDKLGIPFYVWDFSERFKADVIDYFVESYSIGQTPNPCLKCNEKIKFQALAERAYALGFDAIATGHYARIQDGKLRRAIDMDKDQSYVLASLTPYQLSRSLFPLGDTIKPKIREEAQTKGFSVAKKPDSHDICFIPTGETKAFLGSKIGTRPGIVVDSATGDTVANHDGTYGYTIGQRKGLGMTGPAQDGLPRYVTNINAQTSTVTIGKKEELNRFYIEAYKPIYHEAIIPEKHYEIQVRAHGSVVGAVAKKVDEDGFGLYLDEPLQGIANGQLIVVYERDKALGDLVVAAGTISNSYSEQEAHHLFG